MGNLESSRARHGRLAACAAGFRFEIGRWQTPRDVSANEMMVDGCGLPGRWFPAGTGNSAGVAPAGNGWTKAAPRSSAGAKGTGAKSSAARAENVARIFGSGRAVSTLLPYRRHPRKEWWMQSSDSGLASFVGERATNLFRQRRGCLRCPEGRHARLMKRIYSTAGPVADDVERATPS